ncbi:hypothetical protein LB554_13950 [Mesorhizobium sp. CO1-1-11]|uniref:hypothetical protein n=1 Tax=Mesorhizobium sp. CO1-1-11 TaxID=2876636 RepID=UPI001CCBFE52|nr:hypothetical protein [Mesorhizobium sp. CO1-1-11]MBZ9725053.1 hypothetical protein [Mesorhizobium sp. CO1-1-11]
MRTSSDILAARGLAIGDIFGLAGTFVASAPLRETLWAIDGVALVVATVLPTMKYRRLGNDCVAAGFLTFLAGESLLLVGNAAGLQASVPCRRQAIPSWWRPSPAGSGLC